MTSHEVACASIPPTNLSVTLAIFVMALAYAVSAWRRPARAQRSTSAMAIVVGLLYIAGIMLWGTLDESARSRTSAWSPPDILIDLMDGFGAAMYLGGMPVVALLYYRRWHLAVAWGLGAGIAAGVAGIGYYLYGVLQLAFNSSPQHDQVGVYLALRNMQITGTFYGFWFGPFLGLVAYLLWRKKQFHEPPRGRRLIAACLVSLLGGLWMLVWGGMTTYAYHYGQTLRLEEGEGGLWLGKGYGVLYTVFCGHFMLGNYLWPSLWLYTGLLAGITMILGAVLALVGPTRVPAAGILILAAASVGLMAGAGGFLGGVLGIVGGLLALTWNMRLVPRPGTVQLSDDSGKS